MLKHRALLHIWVHFYPFDKTKLQIFFNHGGQFECIFSHLRELNLNIFSSDGGQLECILALSFVMWTNKWVLILCFPISVSSVGFCYRMGGNADAGSDFKLKFPKNSQRAWLSLGTGQPKLFCSPALYVNVGDQYKNNLYFGSQMFLRLSKHTLFKNRSRCS